MSRTAWASAGLLAGGCVLSLAVGPISLFNADLRSVALELRAVRTVLAMIAGASLAVGGVLMQGLFRNPLADPGVIGAQGGAILGGQLAFLWVQLAQERLPKWLLPEMALPLGSVVGAVLALAVLLPIARRARSSLVVLLVGFLIGAFCVSVSGLVSTLSLRQGEGLARGLIAFSLGGVEGKGWHDVALAAPLTLAALIGGFQLGRMLDVLLAGEEEAVALGVPVADLRRWAIVWCAMLTAAASVAAGAIAFVGLIVPHLVRGRVGALHRRVIPLAAVGGAAAVVGADVLSRLLPTPAPLPVSVISGLAGAPFFFWLLLRSPSLTT